MAPKASSPKKVSAVAVAAPAPPRSLSSRIGLIFPIGKIGTYIKRQNRDLAIGPITAAKITATLEEFSNIISDQSLINAIKKKQGRKNDKAPRLHAEDVLEVFQNHNVHKFIGGDSVVTVINCQRAPVYKHFFKTKSSKKRRRLSSATVVPVSDSKKQKAIKLAKEKKAKLASASQSASSSSTPSSSNKKSPPSSQKKKALVPKKAETDAPVDSNTKKNFGPTPPKKKSQLGEGAPSVKRGRPKSSDSAKKNKKASPPPSAKGKKKTSA